MNFAATPASVIEELSPVQPKQSPKISKLPGIGTPKTRKEGENELDPNCIVNIEKRLVRIEYPGEVVNLDKAIETLGGIENIETSVAEHGRKLDLRFHPRNKYNTPCFAEKDFKPGILIKVKKGGNRVSSGQDETNCEYEIEGLSVMNFTFNKLCDFQYLPLHAKSPETKSSPTEYIYEKILPSQLPTKEWLESESAKDMEQFLLPVRFSAHDSANSKVNVDNTDKNEPKLKLKSISNTSSKMNSKQQKNVCRIFRKARQQTSVFVNFNDKEIPMEPLEAAVKVLKHRNLESQIGKVKQLFEERPIWTKAAVRHITGLSDEHSKIVLPVVAYYFINGPWKRTWVKIGYDPTKDPKARIYQTLDYRISAESTKLKVSAKRSYAGKTSLFLGPGQAKKVTLKHDMSARPKMELDERYYVLRPFIIPPARQMFYQFCDLLLPEIQDMISRLPKNCGTFCDPKSGFLPSNFIEQGRQVVNMYVLEAVQRELLEDKKVMQEKVTKEKESKESVGSHLNYYNQMLSTIKKGIYKNVGVAPRVAPRSLDATQMEDVELISLSSDEESEYTVGEIIQSAIPEKLDGGEEEEHSDVSDSSDEAEIDMEAVQEINDMISQFNEKV